MLSKIEEEKNVNDYLFGLECIKICVNITSTEWQQINNNLNVVKFMNSIFQKSFEKNKKADSSVKDDVLLQIVALYGTFSLQVDMAEKVYKSLPNLLSLLNSMFYLHKFFLS